MSVDAPRSNMGSRLRARAARRLVALILFGVSFGYVEAAVVAYLRAIYEPMRYEMLPGHAPGELFPLIRLEQLQAAGDQHVRRLVTELGREAATLLMLAAIALAVARNTRQWLAAFVLAFGIWDIFYYIFLRLLIDWPGSLLTWDILFLLPVPWVGPVLSPVLVAVVMCGCGSLLLWREWTGRPLVLRACHYAILVTGGITLTLAFCWDYRNTAAGGIPNPFNWPLFALGLGMALIGFVHAWYQSSRQTG